MSESKQEDTTMKKLIALALALITLALCAAPALADYTYDPYYIIPDSNIRKLTEDELWGFTRETLRYIRNELLARHGYAFSNDKFYDYFNAKPWYIAGGYNEDSKLTALEWDNITLVKKVEKAMDNKKTENLDGTDIQEIIAYQNYIGGYGNQLGYGNPRGNGAGAIVGSSSMRDEDVVVTPIPAEPNYIYNDQYIIPDSDTRALTEGELWAYTRETLRYIRNELLARHGYVFGGNKFGRYFGEKAWYKAGNYEKAILTALEWNNINLVRLVERKMDILGMENEDGLDIEEIIMYQNGGALPGWYKKP